MHVNINSSFEAEATACAQAVEMGIEKQIQRVKIEGDTLAIIKKCKKQDRDRSKISTIISNIQQNIGLFQQIRFNYIPKVGNSITHFIAKESLRREETFYLERLISKFAKRMLEPLHWSDREPD